MLEINYYISMHYFVKCKMIQVLKQIIQAPCIYRILPLIKYK